MTIFHNGLNVTVLYVEKLDVTIRVLHFSFLSLFFHVDCIRGCLKPYCLYVCMCVLVDTTLLLLYL